jgi:hypothetical protein
MEKLSKNLYGKELFCFPPYKIDFDMLTHLSKGPFVITRIGVLLGILGIALGIFITVGSAIPDLGKTLASPFCDDIDEGRFGDLTCERGEDEYQLEALFAVGGSGMIFAGAMFLVFGLVGGLMASSAKLDRIVKTGEAAQGLILEMQHTGVRVNSQPMIKFKLQVTPPHGGAYEAETNRIIPFGMMGRLGIGMNVPVKYDPNKPQDVALDFDSMRLAPIDYNSGMSMSGFASPAASSQESLSEKLRELEDSYKQGLINQQEYEDARKRILNSL